MFIRLKLLISFDYLHLACVGFGVEDRLFRDFVGSVKFGSVNEASSSFGRTLLFIRLLRPTGIAVGGSML